MIKIAIVGAGYVGLGNALLLAQKNLVKVFDINLKKVTSINDGTLPIEEKLMSRYLKRYKDNIKAYSTLDASILDCRYCLIALPTNFDERKREFDTSSIIETLELLSKINFKNNVIIRSTIPIGFTKKCSDKFPNLKISFFPEFLREGKSLKDNLYPSRIVGGGLKENTEDFAKLLADNARKIKVPIFLTGSIEAESIKLFSNAYLAMRVSFFNELDSFALLKNLNSREIIEGLSLDSRIGNAYNNPSFGYGGYCLPKDVKQLSKSFQSIPHKVIKSLTGSNVERKRIIAQFIAASDYKIIGIYKLSMKANSDNHRESAVIDIVKILKGLNKEVIIFEPNLNKRFFLGCRVESSFESFMNDVDIIVANRTDNYLDNIDKVVFTRDLYRKD